MEERKEPEDIDALIERETAKEKADLDQDLFIMDHFLDQVKKGLHHAKRPEEIELCLNQCNSFISAYENLNKETTKLKLYKYLPWANELLFKRREMIIDNLKSILSPTFNLEEKESEEGKVFAATFGEYDSYGVSAVFDSKDKAQAYIDNVDENWRSGYRIELFPFNPKPD